MALQMSDWWLGLQPYLWTYRCFFLAHFITGSGTTGAPCLTTKLRCSQFWQLHLLFRGWWWTRLFFWLTEGSKVQWTNSDRRYVSKPYNILSLNVRLVWFTNWYFVCFFSQCDPWRSNFHSFNLRHSWHLDLSSRIRKLFTPNNDRLMWFCAFLDAKGVQSHIWC